MARRFFVDHRVGIGPGFVFHFPEQADRRRGHPGGRQGGAHSDRCHIWVADHRPGRRGLGFHLSDRHPGGARPVRPAPENVQPPPGSVVLLFRPHAGGLDHVPRDLRLGTNRRVGDVGTVGRHLGHDEHRHGGLLYVDYQLEAGPDCDGRHPGASGRGGTVQEKDHRGIPQGAQDQLQDHRCLQREHHRRARGQVSLPGGGEPA